MTRTELIKFANENNKNKMPWCRRERQVYSCKAWIIEWDFTDFVLLKSYSTIVGIYSYSTDTMYVFDYYSNTTYKHIYKACRMLNASRITFLYHKSDNIVEKALALNVNTIKLTNSQWKRLEDSDFRCYIETKAFR